VAGYFPIMLAITDDGFKRSVVSRIADRFGKLNGVRPRVITSPPPGVPEDVHPTFYKAWLWDIVPDRVDRIMFMDWDVLPVRPLGEIPDCSFGACRGYSDIGPVSKYLPFIRETGLFFNAGLFLAGEVTRPLFDQVKPFACKWEYSLLRYADQGMFNVLLQDGLDITVLPDDWNYQPAVIGGNYVQEPKMLHFSALGDERWNLMALALDILEADGPDALLGEMVNMDGQNG